MSNSYQAPDLASVLKTLSQFAPSPQASLSTPSDSSFASDHSNRAPSLGVNEYQNPSPIHTHSTSSHTDPRTPSQGSVPGEEREKPASIDPSTILEWPLALRCVMRTVARNDATIASIRKMIHVQHEHEKQWWAGREALLKKQEARIEGREKLNSVLLSIGGHSKPSSAETTAEEDLRELYAYDLKVYKAMTEMVNAMSTELKAFGVPFFGVRSELLRKDGEPAPAPNIDKVDGGGDGKDSGVRVDRSELVMLQRRMLELLEDMCKE